MESMTNAPYLAAGARGGFRYGNTELADAIVKDGLWCAFDACLMGVSTERYTAGGISRDAQDDLAAKSHERAAAAIKDGRFEAETVSVSVPQRKGDPLLVETDEGVRPGTTAESLGGLRAAFDKEGTITAGNASQISDGGSAIVVMSKAEAERRGVTPLGEVVSFGMVAGPDDASLLHQPSRAIMAALDRAGKSVGDVDLFEINEAFAAVGLASMAELGHHRRCRQRERRGHRARSSDRHERQPAGPDPPPRAQAAGWRPGGCRALRRWRPGRRPARPLALTRDDARWRTTLVALLTGG